MKTKNRRQHVRDDCAGFGGYALPDHQNQRHHTGHEHRGKQHRDQPTGPKMPPKRRSASSLRRPDSAAKRRAEVPQTQASPRRESWIAGQPRNSDSPATPNPAPPTVSQLGIRRERQSGTQRWRQTTRVTGSRPLFLKAHERLCEYTTFRANGPHGLAVQD